MLRAIFDSVSHCATLYVPSGAGAADSLLLGAGALATGGGLGGVLTALEARLPVRPARARGAGVGGRARAARAGRPPLNRWGKAWPQAREPGGFGFAPAKAPEPWSPPRRALRHFPARRACRPADPAARCTRASSGRAPSSPRPGTSRRARE